MIIAVFDISVAFFHGKVRKVIHVVPPKDLRKKGMVFSIIHPNPLIAFCPIFVHPLFPVFEPHIQKWFIPSSPLCL